MHVYACACVHGFMPASMYICLRVLLMYACIYCIAYYLHNLLRESTEGVWGDAGWAIIFVAGVRVGRLFFGGMQDGQFMRDAGLAGFSWQDVGNEQL